MYDTWSYNLKCLAGCPIKKFEILIHFLLVYVTNTGQIYRIALI